MQTDQLMLAAILFFAVSALFVTAANALKLGSIFGFLAAGIALGPHSSGPVLTTQVDGLLGIGELGVVLLMFTIGLEMQPARLWAMRRYLLGLGPLQVLLTGLLIGAALATTTTLSVNGAILVGIGLGLSSTAITMQVLGEKGDTATDYGKASFGILVLQDLASVLLLVLVPFLAITKVSSGDGAYPWWEQAGFAVAALGGVVLTGRYVLPYLLAWTARQGSTALFAVVVLVGVLVAALVMDLGGLSDGDRQLPARHHAEQLRLPLPGRGQHPAAQGAVYPTSMPPTLSCRAGWIVRICRRRGFRDDGALTGPRSFGKAGGKARQCTTCEGSAFISGLNSG